MKHHHHLHVEGEGKQPSWIQTDRNGARTRFWRCLALNKATYKGKGCWKCSRAPVIGSFVWHQGMWLSSERAVLETTQLPTDHICWIGKVGSCGGDLKEMEFADGESRECRLSIRQCTKQRQLLCYGACCCVTFGGWCNITLAPTAKRTCFSRPQVMLASKLVASGLLWMKLLVTWESGKAESIERWWSWAAKKSGEKANRIVGVGVNTSDTWSKL